MSTETQKRAVNRRYKFWQQHIFDCSQSLMSQHQYCKTHGLALSTFGYWKRRLSKSTSDRPQFYPLTVQPISPEISGPDGSGLSLHVDRFRINLIENFSTTCLKKLIVTLEQL